MAEQKTITSMMEETRTFPPSKEFVNQAYIKSRAEYEKALEGERKVGDTIAQELGLKKSK